MTLSSGNQRTFANETQPIRKFVKELERRGGEIRNRVRVEFLPEDFELLAKKHRPKIEEWCDQVPFLGLNSGKYDLNLIKEYFADRLTETTNNIGVATNSSYAHATLPLP